MRFAFLAFLVALLAACSGTDDTRPAASNPTGSTTTTATGAGGQGAGGEAAGGAGVGGQGAGGGDTTTSTGSGTGGAAGGTTTTTGEGGAGGGPAPRIQVPATAAEVALPFSFGATGQGSQDIGVVSLAADTGVVRIQGNDVPVVAYQRQPFGEWTLYQALGVQPDRLWVLWMYCNQGELQYVYVEGTDGTPMHYEQASGTCDEALTATVAKPAFPAVDMAYPTPLAGYTMSGADISLPGAAPGSITLGGEDYTLLAFEDVDCTQKCGAPGWREVHTLLWDAPGERVCFAIIYLFQPGQPLLVEYALCIPDLSDPAGQTQLPATFTTP